MPPTTREVRSGLVGGFAGGLLLGVIFAVGADGSYLQMQGAVYLSGPGMGARWVAHLLHSTAFGALYALVAGTFTNWYVNRLLLVTRRSKRLTVVLMPVIRRFGIGTVVAAGMGLTYGLLVWVLFASALLPTVLDAAASSFPQIHGLAVGGYAVYGLVLGVLYGLQLSRV